MKAKLTRSFIDHIAPPTKRETIVWDADARGFGVCIYPNGSKTWVIDYTIDGKRSRRSFAHYDRISPESARSHARKLLASAELGTDPFKSGDEARKQRTLREFSDEYMVRHGEKKRSARNDAGYLKNHILPKIGSKRLSDIKRSDIALLHGVVGKESIYQANRSLALLSKMFNLATIWGFLPENHQNPCKGVPKFKEESRDRFLTEKEMGRLLAAVSRYDDKYITPLILLDLLLGMRLGELLALKWEDIDEDAMQIVLTKTKQGKKHYVPITDAALEIIKAIHPADGNPYVFPGRKRGQHLTGIKKPWAAIREDAGLQDVRYHDLRRTLGSWLAQDGASLALIGTILGHSNQSTTAIYARFKKDSGRQALEDHSKKVIALMEKKKT